MAWRFSKPGQDMKIIDKIVKNPWYWQWLSRNVKKEKRSKYYRKITKPCIAMSVLCNEDINEVKCGWKSDGAIYSSKINFALSLFRLILGV
jgi:hypothetical protein